MNALYGNDIGAEMVIEESWVGVEEVAAHLRVAKASIYRWVESKGFPAHRVGRLLRFKLSEVDEWVKNSGGKDSSPDSPTLASTSQPAPRASQQAGKVRANRPRKERAKTRLHAVRGQEKEHG